MSANNRLTPTPYFLVCLLLAPLSTAQAQTRCWTVTPAARSAITSFLQDPTERPWLERHGISALAAEELVPLTDAADAALCRKIDSTVADPAMRYLRAGAYVIATTHQPIVVVNGVIHRRDLGNDMFVFDSTGRWVHSPGEIVPIAPTDLRLAAASPAAAELRWTNRDSSVTRIQVQRATGAGRHATIATLSATATSYIDTTAAGGEVYRYQLVAVNAEGGMDLSNEVSARIAARSRDR
jgi:hypothetical protein